MLGSYLGHREPPGVGAYCPGQFATFTSNLPAEVRAADGSWHPCTILSVETNGFKCASGSHPTIDKDTVYRASLFRFSTFGPKVIGQGKGIFGIQSNAAGMAPQNGKVLMHLHAQTHTHAHA